MDAPVIHFLISTLHFILTTVEFYFWVPDISWAVELFGLTSMVYS